RLEHDIDRARLTRTHLAERPYELIALHGSGWIGTQILGVFRHEFANGHGLGFELPVIGDRQSVGNLLSYGDGLRPGLVQVNLRRDPLLARLAPRDDHAHAVARFGRPDDFDADAIDTGSGSHLGNRHIRRAVDSSNWFLGLCAARNEDRRGPVENLVA